MQERAGQLDGMNDLLHSKLRVMEAQLERATAELKLYTEKNKVGGWVGGRMVGWVGRWVGGWGGWLGGWMVW